MAPVVLAAQQCRDLRVVLCSSGQHRDMLRHGLEPFGLTPNIDLGAMDGKPGLDELSARLLTKLSEFLRDLRPDGVLVHGDTQTCVCAAQAAFWHRVPLGHVEAGLRSQTRDNPFPEEMNRRLTDAMCDWHFTPTSASRANLLREGVAEESILVTGNTGIDALLLACQILDHHRPQYVDFSPEVLEGRPMILVTGHRRENHGRHTEALCDALVDITEQNPEACVVFPVHLNPNVQRAVGAALRRRRRIFLIPPQPYLPFVDLMKRCRLIITDSGGIQEEAPSLGRHVLVTRQNTERPETLTTGFVHLAGNERAAIRDHALRLLNSQSRTGAIDNPCGDGHAAGRIIQFVRTRLGESLN